MTSQFFQLASINKCKWNKDVSKFCKFPEQTSTSFFLFNLDYSKFVDHLVKRPKKVQDLKRPKVEPAEKQMKSSFAQATMAFVHWWNLSLLLKRNIDLCTKLLLITIILLQSCFECGKALTELEMDALGKLYNSTNGANWKVTWDIDWNNFYQNNWCTFYGVMCSDPFAPVYVQALSLSNNSLNGTLPSELGNLDKLMTLELAFNQLHGTIPSELGNLGLLVGLQLQYNSMQGSIPAELGYAYLSLGNNKLNGTIPKELSTCVQIYALLANDNQLSGSLPAELSELKLLQQLELENNFLEGTIPEEYGDLLQLQWLTVGNNMLEGTIPLVLYQNCRTMATFQVQNNRFHGTIPPDINQWGLLNQLDMSRNFFSGTIPPEIASFPLLDVLLLSHNQLNGTLPPELL
ncbi:hypothetical protein RFI_01244 [Reticulomyxa filosa]|uniref:Leucine-rich repeat-containing N-terminal plant-type domain-containing protein n=1 Tax=Reticulomyxa filosa TaxID=46433 RepID=X6PCI5_RETFI|nr:hypothetical protein RFI_01244 [Reticulomyxa filosa]|eukprot:ETO35818.1 hypothetical protein RFI_01244 [Reticulomyxa filosa]